MSTRDDWHGRKDGQMKRDPDLERQILLAVEAYDGVSRPGYANLSGLEAPDLQVKHEVGRKVMSRKWWKFSGGVLRAV
ncbi:hypothetical protein [Roseovarius sp.]|uniref:hypothetical protein n=1 Tax=Roseovarius sp. TaxID=1486281 RepID=UPI0035672FE5